MCWNCWKGHPKYKDWELIGTSEEHAGAHWGSNNIQHLAPPPMPGATLVAPWGVDLSLCGWFHLREKTS